MIELLDVNVLIAFVDTRHVHHGRWSPSLRTTSENIQPTDGFTLREELLKGEDSTRQFKRQLEGQDHLAKEIAAFLNTRDGRVFVGVDDDGTIVSLSPQAVLAFANTVSNVCSQSITPPCSVLTFDVSTAEGLEDVAKLRPKGNYCFRDNGCVPGRGDPSTIQRLGARRSEGMDPRGWLFLCCLLSFALTASQ